MQKRISPRWNNNHNLIPPQYDLPELQGRRRVPGSTGQAGQAEYIRVKIMNNEVFKAKDYGLSK
jgi:hypothetical protein